MFSKRIHSVQSGFQTKKDVLLYVQGKLGRETHRLHPVTLISTYLTILLDNKMNLFCHRSGNYRYLDRGDTVPVLVEVMNKGNSKA